MKQQITWISNLNRNTYLDIWQVGKSNPKTCLFLPDQKNKIPNCGGAMVFEERDREAWRGVMRWFDQMWGPNGVLMWGELSGGGKWSGEWIYRCTRKGDRDEQGNRVMKPGMPTEFVIWKSYITSSNRFDWLKLRNDGSRLTNSLFDLITFVYSLMHKLVV